jgi:hypothetical protein
MSVTLQWRGTEHTVDLPEDATGKELFRPKVGAVDAILNSLNEMQSRLDPPQMELCLQWWS